MSSFFGGDEREARSDEDVSEASEGSGYGSGSGVVLAVVEEDIFHDPLGCSECRVRGDWEFCKRSRYHPQHDLHECPEGQVCFCLNPKYSYDHFD